MSIIVLVVLEAILNLVIARPSQGVPAEGPDGHFPAEIGVRPGSEGYYIFMLLLDFNQAQLGAGLGQIIKPILPLECRTLPGVNESRYVSTRMSWAYQKSSWVRGRSMGAPSRVISVLTRVHAQTSTNLGFS